MDVSEARNKPPRMIGGFGGTEGALGARLGVNGMWRVVGGEGEGSTKQWCLLGGWVGVSGVEMAVLNRWGGLAVAGNMPPAQPPVGSQLGSGGKRVKVPLWLVSAARKFGSSPHAFPALSLPSLYQGT